MNFFKKLLSVLNPLKKVDDVFKNATRKNPKTILLILVSIISLFNVDAKIISAVNYIGSAVIEAVVNNDNPETPTGE